VRLDVAVTPDALRQADLPASTVLVIDVLRASTSIITALANGCAAVVPVTDADEARRRAATTPGALIAGERRGEPLEGFDLGNSPLEFSAARVSGRTIVFTTSNGTRALVAARSAAAVGVAGLVNASAAAAWAVAQGHDLIVVCAGERGARSLEDHVCAGLLVGRVMTLEPAARLTAAAVEAATLGARYGDEVARLAEESTWARHLIASGRGADVASCLALDTTALVPVYRADVDKVVADVDKVVSARE
jgi:2-phosphosulfolactate phosphatase